MDGLEIRASEDWREEGNWEDGWGEAEGLAGSPKTGRPEGGGASDSRTIVANGADGERGLDSAGSLDGADGETAEERLDFLSDGSGPAASRAILAICAICWAAEMADEGRRAVPEAIAKSCELETCFRGFGLAGADGLETGLAPVPPFFLMIGENGGCTRAADSCSCMETAGTGASAALAGAGRGGWPIGLRSSCSITFSARPWTDGGAGWEAASVEGADAEEELALGLPRRPID